MYKTFFFKKNILKMNKGAFPTSVDPGARVKQNIALKSFHGKVKKT
jgi:hypothetical protein